MDYASKTKRPPYSLRDSTAHCGGLSELYPGLCLTGTDHSPSHRPVGTAFVLVDAMMTISTLVRVYPVRLWGAAILDWGRDLKFYGNKRRAVRMCLAAIRFYR